MPPISAGNTTALLLIDNQLGFRNTSFWGKGASNPNYESNTTALLAKFRAAIDASPQGQRPCIIHVQHKSVWVDSPMHPSHRGPYGADGSERRGIDFLEFAAPRLLRNGKLELVYTFDEPPPPQTDEERAEMQNRTPSDEILMTKHGHGVFINTPLEHLLNRRGIKTLLIAGMQTDVAVSTAVRMAHNLGLVGKWGGRGNVADAPESAIWTDGRGLYVTEDDVKPLEGEEAVDGHLVDMPRIVLIGDATRTFGKAGVDAETVHAVHVESLRDFAEVRRTEEVLAAMNDE
jgi:nicotinamidase-related amidase